MRWFKNWGWRQSNYVMAALIVIIDGYLVMAPLWPKLDLWRRQHQTSAVAGLPYKTKLDKNSPKTIQRAPIPTDNRLIIPKIALNEHIYVGTNPHLVNKGVWDKSQTSTPPQGHNTVMVAHRFTYSGPATFYSLDKLAGGDPIVVYWQGKEFDYTVATSKVVAPTELTVEDPTPKPQLTLYTCTPLWNFKNRLVVVANLDKGVLQ